MSDPGDVTRLLQSAASGDPDAFARLLPLVYDELRRLAKVQLSRERSDHTLQATALVHEAYLRMVGLETIQWKNHGHFFAVAANSIRRILVDHARKHRASKRNSGQKAVSLDLAAEVRIDPDGTDLLALDEVLRRFEREHEDKAQVVMLRFFAGLSSEETAQVLGVATRTVERHWRFSRAWLHDALHA